QLMDCNGIEKEFSNVILKPDKKISWRDIINNIKNKTKETDIDEWKLKKILYDYSFNLPVYSFKDRNELTKKLKKFKGFFVLVDEKLQDDELKEEIKNYGVQKIWNVDIDEKEIEKSENII
ncbi:MAG: hypothetical protein OH351_05050, partial [Candidatus Parvarchaeota archaeon]|nr:hypothetical protein [Candidatus Jingweiarchaeum tengchongense]